MIPKNTVEAIREECQRVAHNAIHDAIYKVDDCEPVKAAVRRALAHMDLSGFVAAPQLPPMDDEMRFILGRPNFTCGGIAQVLRQLGQSIPAKAEEEQAATIYFMLQLYLEHGKDWMDNCEQILRDAPAAPRKPT